MTATAVCWAGNNSCANKLSCVLYTLFVTAGQGSCLAPTADVCLHPGAAAAALRVCLQGAKLSVESSCL